jgi:hypothetical protein
MIEVGRGCFVVCAATSQTAMKTPRGIFSSSDRAIGRKARRWAGWPEAVPL